MWRRDTCGDGSLDVEVGGDLVLFTRLHHRRSWAATPQGPEGLAQVDRLVDQVELALAHQRVAWTPQTYTASAPSSTSFWTCSRT